jgi:hypothetical protein
MNGTFVQGKEVGKGKKVVLAAGDQISISRPEASESEGAESLLVTRRGRALSCAWVCRRGGGEGECRWRRD